MSYVHKKLKVFDRASDVEVRRKKSDGRMKTYVSALDARAWCDSTEERRQYILDLVNYGDASGRIVPLEALMNILMAEKIAELNALKQEIQLLRDYIKSHGLELAEDQFKADSVKGEEMGPIAITEEIEKEPSVSKSKGSREKSIRSVRMESVPKMSPLEDVEEEPTSGEPSVKEPSVEEPSVSEPSVKEPSVKEPSENEPLTEESSQSISTIGTPSISAESSHISGPSAKEPSVKEPSVKEPSVKEPSVKEPSVKEPSVKEPSVKEPSVKEPSVKEPSVKEPSVKEPSVKEPSVKEPSVKEPSVKEPSVEEPPIEEPAVEEPSVKEPSVKEPSVKEPSVKEEQKSRDKEIISIEDTLEIDDEHLITGQEIVEEVRERARSGSEVRRASTQETPTIEVDEYDMLASETVAQAPRRTSVQEVEMVKEARPPTVEPPQEPMEIEEEPSAEKVEEVPETKPEMDELCRKLFELALAAIKQLENINDIVSKTGDKPRVEGEAEETMSDGVDLEERFQKLVGLEDKVKKLKEKADKCCDTDGSTMLLEREDLAIEIQRLRCKCEGSAEDNDRLESHLQNLQCQLEEALLQAREAQLLKMENCCMKVRLEHLEQLHKRYEELVEKTKDYDQIRAEWTVFKAQCGQIPMMEKEIFELRARIADCDRLERERELLMKEIMDCECCIGQQGNEIDKLQCHIECLTRNLDKRQQEAKTSCSSLRAQLEEKEELIKVSDLKLSEVQTELKASIQCVTCETTCLKNRIAELEKELAACAASKEEQANLDKAECESICLRDYIAELEEELESYRSKCDENQCLRNYIKDLKIEMINLKSEMSQYVKAAEESEAIKSEIVNYQQVLKQNEEEINNLTQKLLACGDIQTDLVQTQRKLNETVQRLDEMSDENQKLRELIDKVGNASGDDHLKNMLKQERCAVKCIIERFCTMQGHQDALKKENEELSIQIKRLEQEYLSKFKDLQENLEDAKATIECFKICGEEDQEKDKLIEELKSRLEVYESSEECSCSICNKTMEELIN